MLITIVFLLYTLNLMEKETIPISNTKDGRSAYDHPSFYI